MRRLIVLRPEPGAGATVQRAQDLGLEAVPIPLFAIEPLEWDIPEDRFDALILTSANAIRCAGARLQALRSLPVHAVGSATADAARAAGLQVESVGSGGIDQLLDQLPLGLRLLHLCGWHRRGPGQHGQAITSVPVYRSSVQPEPAGMEDLAGAVVLVHSPRAGRRLSELIRTRASTIIAAISSSAAEACGDGWERVEVAEAPRDDVLLSLGARLCKHSGP